MSKIKLVWIGNLPKSRIRLEAFKKLYSPSIKLFKNIVHIFHSYNNQKMQGIQCLKVSE